MSGCTKIHPETDQRCILEATPNFRDGQPGHFGDCAYLRADGTLEELEERHVAQWAWDTMFGRSKCQCGRLKPAVQFSDRGYTCKCGRHHPATTLSTEALLQRIDELEMRVKAIEQTKIGGTDP